MALLRNARDDAEGNLAGAAVGDAAAAGSGVGTAAVETPAAGHMAESAAVDSAGAGSAAVDLHVHGLAAPTGRRVAALARVLAPVQSRCTGCNHTGCSGGSAEAEAAVEARNLDSTAVGLGSHEEA